MLVFAAFVIFTSYRVVRGLLTGAVPVLSTESDAIHLWASTPWTFAWHLFLWLCSSLLSVGGFLLLFAKLKGLNGPSAETRL